jgi:hypothetical protein
MVRWIALAFGLACFAAPSVLFARPMTQHESRCFEASEAVYQANEPQGWDGTEPAPIAEALSERAMIECLDREPVSYSSDEPDDDFYGFENYVCR